MELIKYPSPKAVTQALEADEPILALISFDGSTAILSHVDDAVEHHILLAKVDIPATHIDRYFRIVADKSGADWTFICPPDYKSIQDRQHRLEAFYKDGFTVIAAFLHEIGLLVGINIPKRYR